MHCQIEWIFDSHPCPSSLKVVCPIVFLFIYFFFVEKSVIMFTVNIRQSQSLWVPPLCIKSHVACAIYSTRAWGEWRDYGEKGSFKFWKEIVCQYRDMKKSKVTVTCNLSLIHLDTIDIWTDWNKRKYT